MSGVREALLFSVLLAFENLNSTGVLKMPLRRAGGEANPCSKGLVHFGSSLRVPLVLLGKTRRTYFY